LISPETELLNRFNEAFNRHDVDAMMAAMTGDCVFENTWPAPDGTRYEGQEAVGQFWREFFRSSLRAHIELEETLLGAGWAVQRWAYSWVDEQDAVGHVRGVDIFRFRGGLIAEKLSYVKG
jgi:hypothetical protein